MKKEIKTIKLDKFLNSLGLAMAMAHANYDKAFESIQDRFKTFENTPVQERAILFALKTLHKDLKTQFWQEVEKLTPENIKIIISAGTLKMVKLQSSMRLFMTRIISRMLQTILAVASLQSGGSHNEY